MMNMPTARLITAVLLGTVLGIAGCAKDTVR